MPESIESLQARRMGYHHQASGERAQGDKPFLSIVETVILKGDARSGKYLFGVLKSQTMLGEVAPVLRLGTTEKPQSFWDAKLCATPYPL